MRFERLFFLLLHCKEQIPVPVQVSVLRSRYLSFASVLSHFSFFIRDLILMCQMYGLNSLVYTGTHSHMVYYVNGSNASLCFVVEPMSFSTRVQNGPRNGSQSLCGQTCCISNRIPHSQLSRRLVTSQAFFFIMLKAYTVRITRLLQYLKQVEKLIKLLQSELKGVRWRRSNTLLASFLSHLEIGEDLIIGYDVGLVPRCRNSE